ncbi:hypothetical protein H2201_006630 [Coniosporium apollinis]|uniref:Uncharacterized protein n=1 Tax=Coniosporium apollinis TaxID=61459 RepID=A0ABQ9NSX4_9PEZI|nr:hypothetical protein H2201_006630 [Coniosporium apollinis]
MAKFAGKATLSSRKSSEYARLAGKPFLTRYYEGSLVDDDWVIEILDVLNRKTGPSSDFGRHLEAIKMEFSRASVEARESGPQLSDRLSSGLTASPKLSRKRRMQTSTSDKQATPMTVQDRQIERWSIASYDLQYLLKCDFAQGRPACTARRQQALELFKKVLLRMAKTGPTEEAFTAWVETIPEARSFLLAATSVTEARALLPNLLMCFSPDDSLADNEQLMRVALVKLHKWLNAIVQAGSEEEHAFFVSVPEGLDVRNTFGKSLGVSPPGAVTVPLQTLLLSLQTNPMKKDFLRLWELRTGLVVNQVLGLNVNRSSTKFPTSFLQGHQASLPLIYNLNSKAKTTLQSLVPVHPGDTLWLVHAFLSEEFPEGGEVDCGNPTIDPQSPSVWTKVERFCSAPGYSNHPHLQELKALSQMAKAFGNDSKRAGTTLLSALELLRPPVGKTHKSVRVKLPGGPSKVIGKQIYQIGASAPSGVLQDHGFPQQETAYLNQKRAAREWET